MAGLSRLFGRSKPAVLASAVAVVAKPERLDGQASTDYLFKKEQPAALVPAAAVAVGPALQGEQIKLVIWDLDDTFWTGTLAEGGITIIEANMSVVRELTARGIVNSICSKNNFDPTRAELERHGIWDHFIFPRIAFAPKGELIQDIIKAAQLRAPNVLFIDDNPVNINEALHYNPGLQVCAPDAIPGLLNDPRCKGKPDPAHARLADYKVLEAKHADQAATGGDNHDFLRQSDIRVSLHHDILAEFPRIHDLVNRSNQLNFTKKRWPEDLEAARAAFEKEAAQFYSQAGYVKVADRYGSYGIVGFYLTQGQSRRCVHFLFSCRTLNMGIEQFVWHQLKQPEVKVVGEVVSRLDAKPDWITLVDDAGTQAEVPGNKPKLCLRGSCDLQVTAQYLQAKFETIEEFNYDYAGWIISPVARAVALETELRDNEAGRALLPRLPGIPRDGFRSAINSGEADVYVLSFSPEWFPAYYRSKSTGLLFPVSSWLFGGVDFANTDFAKVTGKLGKTGLTREKWAFLQNELEFCGPGDEKQIAADVRQLLAKLAGKLVIVISLNVKYGRDWMLINKLKRVESIVMPVVWAAGCHVIDVHEHVKGWEDLDPAQKGGHYRREVYLALANRITAIVVEHAELQQAAVAC